MGTRSGTRFHELALWSAPERVRGTFHWRMAVSSRFVDEWLRMSRASRTSGSRRLQLTSGERAHHGASPNSLSLTQKGQRTADLLQAVEARASVLFGFLFVLLFCLPSCRAPPPRRPCRRRCVVLPRREQPRAQRGQQPLAQSHEGGARTTPPPAGELSAAAYWQTTAEKDDPHEPPRQHHAPPTTWSTRGRSPT